MLSLLFITCPYLWCKSAVEKKSNISHTYLVKVQVWQHIYGFINKPLFLMIASLHYLWKPQNPLSLFYFGHCQMLFDILSVRPGPRRLIVLTENKEPKKMFIFCSRTWKQTNKQQTMWQLSQGMGSRWFWLSETRMKTAVTTLLNSSSQATAAGA